MWWGLSEGGETLKVFDYRDSVEFVTKDGIGGFVDFELCWVWRISVDHPGAQKISRRFEDEPRFEGYFGRG